MKTIRLHDGKERSMLRGYHWVYDTAIALRPAGNRQQWRALGSHD